MMNDPHEGEDEDEDDYASNEYAMCECSHVNRLYYMIFYIYLSIFYIMGCSNRRKKFTKRKKR